VHPKVRFRGRKVDDFKDSVMVLRTKSMNTSSLIKIQTDLDQNIQATMLSAGRGVANVASRPVVRMRGR
jgi:hypothetical protein